MTIWESPWEGSLCPSMEVGLLVTGLGVLAISCLQLPAMSSASGDVARPKQLILGRQNEKHK